MVHLRLLVLLAALGVLVSAGAGQAKMGLGYDYAKLTGPGLNEALVIQDTSPPYLLNAELFEMATGRQRIPSISEQARGPRYRLTYYLKDSTVQVDFYPYARPRPLAFVPTGQSVTMSSERRVSSLMIESGWYDYPPPLVENLIERGLPAEAPEGPPIMWLFAAVVIAAIAWLLVKRMQPPRARSHPLPA